MPALGPVLVDIAFGGVFYALAIPRRGPPGRARHARALVGTGMAILEAAQARIAPEHPERPGLAGLAYLMWCGDDEHGPRNATVMPPGRLDRSPCGTGSSARLAVMHRRRQAKEGDKKEFRSTIGTRFEAEIVAATRLADGRPAILPRITGRAWIFSREEIAIDPSDPFPLGHALPDIWGPGVPGDVN